MLFALRLVVLVAVSVKILPQSEAFVTTGLQAQYTHVTPNQGTAVRGLAGSGGNRCGSKSIIFATPAIGFVSRRGRSSLALRAQYDESDEEREEVQADEGMSMLNPVEQEFMDGWNTIVYGELRRRAAVVGEEEGKLPSSKLEPREVISTVMDALLNNDEPFPDHGCALAIRFSSARNPVGHWQGPMLGNMLRKTDYAMVISDGQTFEFLGDMHYEKNKLGEFAVQDILVEGIHDSSLALRWQLSRDPATKAWLTDTVAIIRPGPI